MRGLPFVCSACGWRSYSVVDLEVGWCGRCRLFTRDTPEQTSAIADTIEQRGEPILAGYVRRRLELVAEYGRA